MRDSQFVVGLICVVAVMWTAGCGPKAVESAIPKASPAVDSGARIQSAANLGVVMQGETAQIRQWVRNPSDQQIVIAKIEKSCECLDVRLKSMQIAPGDRVLADFVYDGAKEPDFLGSLLIDVKLLDEKGSSIGRIDVSIDVVASKDH